VVVLSLAKGYILTIIQDPSSEKITSAVKSELDKVVSGLQWNIAYPKELSEHNIP